MNRRKYKDRYMTTFNCEREIYKTVEQNLPRGVSVSDEINAFLRDKYEQIQNEKNLNPLNLKRIQIPMTSDSNNNTQDKDLNLDILNLSIRQVVEELEKIADIKTLADLESKGKIIMNKSKILKHERIYEKKAIDKLQVSNIENNKESREIRSTNFFRQF